MSCFLKRCPVKQITELNQTWLALVEEYQNIMTKAILVILESIRSIVKTDSQFDNN